MVPIVKIFTFICLASLLGLSSALRPNISEIQLGFANLEHWLNTNTADSDPQDDLYAVTIKFKKTKEIEKAPASESVKRVGSASECDDSLIEAFNYIATSINPIVGVGKVDKLLRYYINESLVSKCDSYLNGKFSAIYDKFLNQNNVTKKFLEFFKTSAVKSVELKRPEKQKEILKELVETNDPKIFRLNVTDVAQYLVDVTKTDDGAKAKYKKEHWVEGTDDIDGQRNFNFDLDKFVIKPCKYLTSIFAEFFDQIYAVKSLDPNVKIDQDHSLPGPALTTNPMKFETQSLEFFTTMFRYKTCRALLYTDRNGLVQIFKEAKKLS